MLQKIILGGLKRANEMPKKIIVSDTNIDVLNKLKEKYPEISIAINDNKLSASQELVFLAVHPPAVSGVTAEIIGSLKPDVVLVSLAPKLTIMALSNLLNGFQRIVRMIPNAPTIINSGYNPVVFSQALNKKEQGDLLAIFSKLGDCPVVSEESLEAYAIITAMCPTYLWFQMDELYQLGKSFSLSDKALNDYFFTLTYFIFFVSMVNGFCSSPANSFCLFQFRRIMYRYLLRAWSACGADSILGVVLGMCILSHHFGTS